MFRGEGVNQQWAYLEEGGGPQHQVVPRGGGGPEPENKRRRFFRAFTLRTLVANVLTVARVESVVLSYRRTRFQKSLSSKHMI